METDRTRTSRLIWPTETWESSGFYDWSLDRRRPVLPPVADPTLHEWANDLNMPHSVALDMGRYETVLNETNAIRAIVDQWLSLTPQPGKWSYNSSDDCAQTVLFFFEHQEAAVLFKLMCDQ